MKEYHKILYYNKGIMGAPVIAFNKLDGSNIRVEWSKKRAFYKFGTRTQMLDKTNPTFGPAIDIFKEKYFDELHKFFSTEPVYRNCQTILLYLEYFGPNSFAGQHEETDIMDLILIDVWKHKKGWVEPRDFDRQFSHLGIPEIIYRGNLNQEFIENVKNNIYNLKEGVVAKGTQQTKRVDRKVWMIKIKTSEWHKRLKDKCGEKALLEDVEGDTSILK
jgi:hypothetical protein